MTTNKENFEEEYGADSEWLIPLYTNEVSIEDKKTAVRTLIHSTRADERKKLVKVVKGMERHSWDSGIYNKALEDVLAKISQVWHLNRH